MTDSIEFGAGEAAKKWEDEKGAKFLEEIGIKLPKTLKDMLIILMNKAERKCKKIQTLGMINAEFDQLGKYLDEVDINEILNLVNTLLNDESKFCKNDEYGCLSIIAAIFKSSVIDDYLENYELQELRNKRHAIIIKEIIKWLSGKNDENSPLLESTLNDLVSICIKEISLSSLDSPITVQIFVECINCIIQAIGSCRPLYKKFFSFLPNLMYILEPWTEMLILPSGESMTIQDYKYYLISKMCCSRWNTKNVLSLTGELRDIQMSDNELELVINKILRQFDSTEINELPLLIFQLLLLSRKGHKNLVLKGISEYFSALDEEIKESHNQNDEKQNNSMDSISYTQLNIMEGTIIIHINFAITQDQELGNEFLRYMKSGKASLLTPFNLCCLLSMARIHRFQDLSSIMAVYKDKEKLESAKWISSNYNNNNNHVYFLMLDGYLYNKSLFIFILELDISQIVSLIPLDDLFKKVLKKTSFGYDNVIQSLVQLGTFIMDSTISSASCVKITEKKIGSKTPNEAASDLGVIILLEMFKMHEMVRVEILDQIQSRVVSRSPSVGHFLTLLEIIVKEKPDSLNDYIQRIKGTLDHFSLLPSYIADHLLRALQPIIYRNISIRDGLMLVLRKCVLRKCYSQQSQIRLSLYEGLSKLMDDIQDLNPVIFDILYFQFQRFLEMQTDVHFTVNLETCIETNNGTPSIVEPLPRLFSCLSKSITSYKKKQNSGQDEFDESQLSECVNKLDLLAEKFAYSEMIEFRINEDADYKMVTNVGIQNNMCASLLLGCYEASIEYIFFSREKNNDTSNLILKLFNKYLELFMILKEKSVNARGRKTVASVTEYSILSFKCIVELFQLTFNTFDCQISNNAGTILRSNSDFVNYITALAHNKISQITTNFDPGDQSTLKYCISLAQVFMNEFIKKNKANINCLQIDNKNQSILATAIESFMLLCKVILKCWPDKLMDFLEMSYPSDEKKLIITSLSEQIPRIKEASELCQIITLLSSYFTFNSNDNQSKGHQELIIWLRMLCKEHAIDNVALTKIIVSMLIKLEKEMSDFDIVSEFGRDILSVLGGCDVYSESDESQMPKFAIVNSRTSNIVCVILLEFIEQTYDEIEWLLIRMKLINRYNDDEEPIDLKEFENSICKKLVILINTLIHLEQTSLQSAPSEALIKCLQKTYKKIAEAGEISKQFIDVVEKTGLHLTEHLYSFIMSFGQTNEAARIARESKMVPKLIFMIEQFERYLIQLSKKSKKANLIQYIKRSTARDFRIETKKIDELENKIDDDDNNKKKKPNTKKKTKKNNQDKNEDTVMNGGENGEVVENAQNGEAEDVNMSVILH
ncbi:9670_t:CDS:10 [Entrophospora sp. SA101]|nr:9670_t:CDS:10 [Entrophospora sp. SA101]